MNLRDLAANVRNELIEKRKRLCENWKQNEKNDICFTNTEGTRYFRAKRIFVSWSKKNAGNMKYGGGTYWRISYGKIKWVVRTDKSGKKKYLWVETNLTFTKSLNGTIIPKDVKSKTEVLDITKQIGTLVM